MEIKHDPDVNNFGDVVEEKERANLVIYPSTGMENASRAKTVVRYFNFHYYERIWMYTCFRLQRNAGVGNKERWGWGKEHFFYRG